MRKLSLALAALFSFAVSAEAAPYKMVDNKGKAFGPVIGAGTMIVTAPDQTPVAVFVTPRGFVNSLPPKSSPLPFIYLNDPTCSTQAYLIEASVPATGLALLADENEIVAPSATILYANTSDGFVGPAQTYVWIYNDSSSSYVCQPAPLPSSVPIGPVASFPISYSAPFRAVPWLPAPTQ
jgi:hypothetical protein